MGFLMMQGKIWPIVIGTGVSLTSLSLEKDSALTKIGNKVDLNRSNLRFLKTRVKWKKLENLKFLAQGSCGINPAESSKL